MNKNQTIRLNKFSIKKSSINKLSYPEYNNGNLNKTFYDQQNIHTKEFERLLSGDKKQKKKENKIKVKVQKINIKENNSIKDSKYNNYNSNIIIKSNTDIQNYFNNNERNSSPLDSFRKNNTQINNNNFKNYLSNSNILNNNSIKKINNNSYIINMNNKDNMKMSNNSISKTIKNNNNIRDDDIYYFNNNNSIKQMNNSRVIKNNSIQRSKNGNIINNNSNNQNIFNNNDSYNIKDSKYIKTFQQRMNQNINQSQFNNNVFNQNIINSNNNYLFSTMIDSKKLQKNPINKEEEQEKRDTLIKTKISIEHSLRLSKYYEYENPDEKEKGINKLLSDMSIYGETTKREILKEKEINPNKFISIDEALEKGSSYYDFEGFQNEYFILALLAKVLMNEGCVVSIERDKPNNKEENYEKYTTLQFLINGMFNLKKYICNFDFGEEKNNILLNNFDVQNEFNLKLKIKLSSLLKLNINDIIICNPRYGSYEITAIIKQNSFYELTEKQLYEELSKDPMFTKIKSIEKNILLSGCKLNPFMLDSRGNNKDGGWGINEKRGSKPYYPPIGWIGYGLNVLDRFDNGDNTWLDYRNISNGEWAVAFHGVGSLLYESQIKNIVKDIVINNLKSGKGQFYKNSNDAFHEGEKVGEGVYITPKPEVMEEYCGEIKCGEKNYIIGIMARVNPKLIRCPVEKQDYWVINGTDNEIRPYRILIKELN